MRNTATPRLKTSEKEFHSAFNVVIVYEDFETGKHAKRTYDFLADHLGEECPFNNQMWKFDVLAVPKLREMAARDAATADIIIVAAHGGTDLPPEVKSWVELWVAHKPRAIALVGLFDASEYLHNPARTHLAAAAKRAKIEFFSQPGPLPGREVESDASASEARAGKAFTLLAEMTHHNRNISHWGINE